MVKVAGELVSDEDAQALQSTPDGWTVIPVLGWWYAGLRWAVLGDDFSPLGPFPDARSAVAAACRADQLTREEPGHD